jgi:hypothetical protein
MDLVIPLPPKASEEARRLADEMDVSLAELFVIAFYQYWGSYKRENITAALDEIYEHEESSLDPQLRKLQSDSLDSDKW